MDFFGVCATFGGNFAHEDTLSTSRRVVLMASKVWLAEMPRQPSDNSKLGMALSARAAPRVERLVRQTLESGVVCFLINLGRLRGGLVRLPLMLLSPASRSTTACCLGMASLCQQRGRHYCDDEFRNRGFHTLIPS